MHANRTNLTILVGAVASFAATLVLPQFVARLSRDTVPQVRPAPLEPQGTTLDVVIPAYLEAGIISTKIRELRSSFKLSRASCRIIVVASDRSTADAAEAAGADHVILTTREGKAKAINTALGQSRADVVAITDANCSVEPSNWVDLALGELSASHLISAEKTESAGDEKLLHLLDGFLRRGSFGTRSSIGVYGEFVMMRRDDFEPIPEGIILDDVALGLSFGRRSLNISTTARIWTVEPSPSRKQQWERRVRIAEGLLTESLFQIPQLVRFRAGRIFAAHKLGRVSLAPVSFWVGVIAFCGAVPKASPIIALGGPLLVLGYAGAVPIPRWLGPLSTLVGLQAVPVFATARGIRARGLRGQSALWRKVAR